MKNNVLPIIAGCAIGIALAVTSVVLIAPNKESDQAAKTISIQTNAGTVEGMATPVGDGKQVMITIGKTSKIYTAGHTDPTGYLLVANDGMGQAFRRNWKAESLVEVKGYVHAIAQH